MTHACASLTDLTVSVVFLDGIVFGEAHAAHPLDAFGRGQSRNLKHTLTSEQHRSLFLPQNNTNKEGDFVTLYLTILNLKEV